MDHKAIIEKLQPLFLGILCCFGGAIGLWVAGYGIATGRVKSQAGPDSYYTFADDPITVCFAIGTSALIGIPFTILGLFIVKACICDFLKKKPDTSAGEEG